MSPRQASASRMARSAHRAMSVLMLLAEELKPLSTMTIARELGIPKSSTHHLLNTMAEDGFVMYYEADRAWGLGVRVFEVGSAYLRSAPLQRLGRPVLTRLTEELEETAHLAVLHGTDVLYIDKEQAGGSAPQLVTEVGVRLPSHLTAVGRAMLAALSGQQVRAIYSGQPLVKRTASGPSSVKELLAGFEEVRVHGYAVDREMVTPGITCVAAAVYSSESLPVAAIGLTFLTAAYPEDDLERIGHEIRSASEELSRSLGWSGPGTQRGREAA